MEPRIQYAKTKDGVSIAFCTLGEGTPLVHMPYPLNHLQRFWQSPVWRPWFEKLAGRYRLVQYDGRGYGMSQRGLSEYSLDDSLRDLEAVVDRLELDRFVLFGPYGFGQAAVRYATQHQERVAALILWGPYAKGDAFDAALIALSEQNWEFFLQTVALALDWLDPRDARDYIDVLRESTTHADWVTMLNASRASDVESLLPQLRTPTLVLHPRELLIVKAQEAMRVASLIPDAHLVMLEGGAAIPTGENVEPALRAIDEFLEDLTVGHAAEEGQVQGAFRTILFTDVEGSTAITDRLGDAKAREVLREHERIVRQALKAHGGAEVKTLGDGFMASFSSATRALECAIAVQRSFAAHNESAEEPILVRVGLNAGEPIEEDADLFGTAVNLAARIAARAQSGEVLASDVVRQLVAGKDFLFSDRGETALRGFEDPVRLYEVRWREEG